MFCYVTMPTLKLVLQDKKGDTKAKIGCKNLLNFVNLNYTCLNLPKKSIEWNSRC